MRILVGWDDPAEAETIGLVLNVDENMAEVYTEPAEYVAALGRGGWDTILLALNFPTEEESFDLFQRSRRYAATLVFRRRPPTRRPHRRRREAARSLRDRLPRPRKRGDL